MTKVWTDVPHWTDNIITPDVTRIKKIHIQEIRDYMDIHHFQATSGPTNTPVHPIATHDNPGFMSAAHWDILNTFQADWITSGNGVMTVVGSLPIISSGGANPTIDINEATELLKGAMSAADKIKLDGIEVGAQKNTYVHPLTHPASMIVETPDQNFVSSTEKANWNNKQIAVSDVTPGGVSGLMSGADKTKLDLVDGFPVGTVIMYTSLETGITIDTWFNMGTGNALAVEGNPFSKFRLLTEFRDRFPMGASYTVADTDQDGLNQFHISKEELPSHTHAYAGDDQLGTDSRGGVTAGALLFTEDEIAANPSIGRINYDADSRSGHGRNYKTREWEQRDKMHNNTPAYFALHFLMKVLA